MLNLSYQKIFSDVRSQDVEDDGLVFLSETIRAERIREEEGVFERRLVDLGGGARGIQHDNRLRYQVGDTTKLAFVFS